MQHETLNWTAAEEPGFMYAETSDEEFGFSAGPGGWEVWGLSSANRLHYSEADSLTEAMRAAEVWWRSVEEAMRAAEVWWRSVEEANQ